MSDLRYWLYDSERLSGPYTAQELELAVPSDSALVCEEARSGMSREDWKPALDVVGESALIPQEGSTTALLAQADPIGIGPAWLAGVGEPDLGALSGFDRQEGGADFFYSEILYDDLMPPFLSAGLFLEGMVPEPPQAESNIHAIPARESAPPPPQDPIATRGPLSPPAPPHLPLSAPLAFPPSYPPPFIAESVGVPPPVASAGLASVPAAAAPGDFLSEFKLPPPKTFKLAEGPPPSASSIAVPAESPGAEPELAAAPQASAPAMDIESQGPIQKVGSSEDAPSQQSAPLEGVPPPQDQSAPPSEAGTQVLEAQPLQGSSGLEAVLEPAFFSQEPQAQPLEPEGSGAQHGEALADSPHEQPPAATDSSLPVEGGASPGAEAAGAGGTVTEGVQPDNLTIGATTQEVISKLAKPTNEPSKDAKKKTQKKKAPRMARIALAASILILGLAWFFLMERRSPPETPKSGDLSTEQDIKQAQQVLAQVQEEVAANQPPTGTADSAAQNQLSSPQQGAMPQPLPVTPPPQQAVPPPPSPEENAVAMVRDYPLDGGRKNVGSWLAQSMQAPRFQQQWSAGALGQGSYLVEDRVSNTEESTAVVYLFEADLGRHTVKADNTVARSLWK